MGCKTPASHPSWDSEREENVALLAVLFIKAFLYKMTTNLRRRRGKSSPTHTEYYFKFNYGKNHYSGQERDEKEKEKGRKITKTWNETKSKLHKHGGLGGQQSLKESPSHPEQRGKLRPKQAQGHLCQATRASGIRL